MDDDLGIGRAGLVACCFLLKTQLCRTPERAIRLVRLRRSPKAIETQRQEGRHNDMRVILKESVVQKYKHNDAIDYIAAYHQWLKDGKPLNRRLTLLGSMTIRSIPPSTLLPPRPGIKLQPSSSWGPESRDRALSS